MKVSFNKNLSLLIYINIRKTKALLLCIQNINSTDSCTDFDDEMTDNFYKT